MDDFGLITIELVSYCIDNPGIVYPGFCSIFGDGNIIEKEAKFICGFGIIKNANTGIEHPQFAVACGFINESFSMQIKAYKNSVVECDNNSNYALSGYYAFYFNKIERQRTMPGQRIIISGDNKDEGLARKIIDISGYRGVQTAVNSVVAKDADRESETVEINGLGIGFFDERYQKGETYYPKAYIPKTMKDNIKLACDFINRYGRWDTCDIVSVISDGIQNTIGRKVKSESALINRMSDLFEKRACPGIVEITYQGDRWEDQEYIRNMAYAFSDIVEGSWKCNKGQACYVYNCVMLDGSLFCATSLNAGKGVRVMCHIDGKTLVGDSHGIDMWENGSKSKMHIVKEEDI